MFGNFYSTGQACSNGTRVFVQEGTKDKFLSRVKERTKKILIGDPMDEATQLGPMVFKAQRDKALDYIEKGKAEGALLLATLVTLTEFFSGSPAPWAADYP